MIARLLAAIRSARIAHYHRKARAAGAATLAAQIDRDWAAAGRHMRRMHAEQAKRDRLVHGQCPPCNHDCNEGRWCPARLRR